MPLSTSTSWIGAVTRVSKMGSICTALAKEKCTAINDKNKSSATRTYKLSQRTRRLSPNAKLTLPTVHGSSTANWAVQALLVLWTSSVTTTSSTVQSQLMISSAQNISMGRTWLSSKGKPPLVRRTTTCETNPLLHSHRTFWKTTAKSHYVVTSFMCSDFLSPSRYHETSLASHCPGIVPLND
jgi:hypothetical protein